MMHILDKITPFNLKDQWRKKSTTLGVQRVLASCHAHDNEKQFATSSIITLFNDLSCAVVVVWSRLSQLSVSTALQKAPRDLLIMHDRVAKAPNGIEQLMLTVMFFSV